MLMELSVNSHTSQIASVADSGGTLRHSLRNSFGESGLAWMQAGHVCARL
jgi:hypothetical protein